MYHTYRLSFALADILELFGSVLGCIMSMPELRFFLGAALVLIFVGLFAWVFRRGRKGKL